MVVISGPPDVVPDSNVDAAGVDDGTDVEMIPVVGSISPVVVGISEVVALTHSSSTMSGSMMECCPSVQFSGFMTTHQG
jgi:hypothetical protein